MMAKLALPMIHFNGGTSAYSTFPSKSTANDNVAKSCNLITLLADQVKLIQRLFVLTVATIHYLNGEMH